MKKLLCLLMLLVSVSCFADEIKPVKVVPKSHAMPTKEEIIERLKQMAHKA